MFNLNLKAVEKMTNVEKRDAEIMYLTLAYLYENDGHSSGSRAMRRSPEAIVTTSYSFPERQLLSSYKELFILSESIKERAGIHLIGFVSKDEKTPKNALNAWRQIYRAIDDLKDRAKSAK